MENGEMKEIKKQAEEMDDLVELVDENDVVRKFYHVGTIDYKGEWYAGFEPAEEMDGAEPDELVIFKLEGDEENEVLKPIDDDVLLEEVYEEFCRQLDEAYDEDIDDAVSLDCNDDCSACQNQCPKRHDN